MDYSGKKHLLIGDIDVMADRSVSCRNPTSRAAFCLHSFGHSAIGIEHRASIDRASEVIIEEHECLSVVRQEIACN